MQKNNRSSWMLVASMFIFGTLSPFVRNISVTSGELALYRAVLAAVCIGGYLLISRQAIDFKTIRKELLLLLISGGAMGFNWILLFQAYKYTTVSVATLSYYFAPVIVTAACPILFREKLTGKQILCFVMSTIGLVLITVTGDMAYPGQLDSYEAFAQLLDSYGIPWTIVWGNHDHQSGIEPVLEAAELFKKHPLCQFEDGDPAFGNGNYILGICDGDKPITALFMIDSHNSIEVDMPDGERKWVYDKLWPDQLEWIKSEAIQLKKDGYKDAMMMLHMPLYAYRAAALKVFPDGHGGDSDVYGQQHELIASHPFEDGVLPILQETRLINHVLAGHDHCNNFMVDYEGIKLMFACKTGPGCYWQKAMNGGTVITISGDGIKDVHHDFIDVTHLVEGTGIKDFEYNWDK